MATISAQYPNQTMDDSVRLTYAMRRVRAREGHVAPGCANTFRISQLRFGPACRGRRPSHQHL